MPKTAMANEMAAERERFARDFLRHHGAKLSGPQHGAFDAELPPPLARKLGLRGQTELKAAFRPADLDARPDAMLLAPGSPVFDHMLALALRGGGSSRRYVRRDGTAEAAATGCRAEVRFSFRISYRAFETLDEVRSIVVDAATGATADGRDYFRAKNLADEPDPALAEPAAFDLEQLLRRALGALEAEIGPAVARFAQRAESQLARENERLQGFYTALIAEEKARRERSTTTPLAAAAEKVEWRQKLDREARLFAPQVKVALIGIEEIWLPTAKR
ncbi:MAG TPA: hypothetical protein VNM87_13275 [Candidatus Udaeobacter sp.]|nr:hypothetical protein [Candidatus Udaeobacter sp.]